MTTAVGSTPTTNTASTTSSSTSAARTSLTSNFQTFLTLLTTQLQNQDPTSPMDSNQFTQQLVEYSQVEQQLDTNTKLDSLISLSSNQSSNLAMSYLGKNVTLTDGSGTLANSSATWAYSNDNAAAATTLTVKDSSGNVVYSAAGDATSGTHKFTWDGKDAQGDVQPDGLYTMTVSSQDSAGKKVTTSVASSATVSGVDMSGSSPMLVIGNAEVPLTSATMVTN
ncbi:MAG: flagellar hook capping FlgD N-terminal domain-containing protein [Rhizomicrobium sp.]|nr:flagellar hook capping FlgD N-terminal domain-containing protein [Rhizomicrobium sp.]